MKKYTFDDIREKGLLLYEYIRGSVSQGINTPLSDVDHGGIYMAPVEQLLGLGLDYQDEIKDEKEIRRALKNKKKALKTSYRLFEKGNRLYRAETELGDEEREKLQKSVGALALNLLSYKQSLEPHDYLSEVTDFVNLTPEEKEKRKEWLKSGAWSNLRGLEAPPERKIKAKDYAATPEVVYEPPKEAAKEIADAFKEGAESAEKRIGKETAEKIEEVKSTTANIGLPYSKQALF